MLQCQVSGQIQSANEYPAKEAGKPNAYKVGIAFMGGLVDVYCSQEIFKQIPPVGTPVDCVCSLKPGYKETAGYWKISDILRIKVKAA